MANWKKTEYKLKSFSKNITFSEITSLLEHYGYRIDNGGSTSGSRVRFICDGHEEILLHKPHPQKELKDYVVKRLHYHIEKEGFWNE